MLMLQLLPFVLVAPNASIIDWLWYRTPIYIHILLQPVRDPQKIGNRKFLSGKTCLGTFWLTYDSIVQQLPSHRRYIEELLKMEGGMHPCSARHLLDGDIDMQLDTRRWRVNICMSLSIVHEMMWSLTPNAQHSIRRKAIRCLWSWVYSTSYIPWNDTKREVDTLLRLWWKAIEPTLYFAHQSGSN